MKRLRHILLLTLALTPLALGSAAAGPRDPVVVSGSANVVNPGSANVTVNQFSDRAIINWRLFDVGANERVQFVQPNSGSIILNRVTGGLGPSMIFGTIDANGHVFIINRDGILFGPNAVVNTSGLLATTSDIRNQDFMAGRFNFGIPGRPDASIVNLGTITANNGGFAALVAPGVRNSGTITATLGTVSLAAGNTFSLDFYGDKLVTLSVGDQIAASVKDVATGLPLNALVTNDGKIKANGGRVELTAAAARQVVDAVINTSGVIEANTIGTHKGMIVLGAATATTKAAGAPVQTVKISGIIRAEGKKKGTKGGTVIVAGENIVVSNATINVSGRDAGGKVLIGGDWGGGHPDKSLVSNPSAQLESFAVPTASTVSVDAASTINASAIDKGNGGKVILWADSHLTFAGTILATGGLKLGTGGFVETSAETVNISGTVNAGNKGTWLLDPGTLVIDSTLAGSIMTSLNNGTSVTETTTAPTAPGQGDGDIVVDASIHWHGSATLTLSSYRNILLNYGVVISNTGSGDLILRADNTGRGWGTVTFDRHSHVSLDRGDVSIYYDPAYYSHPTNFSRDVSTHWGGHVTAYMLVNSVSDLAAIATNLHGTYALGRDIDAGSNPNFAPIASISFPFRGILDGNGGLGVNYTISNLTIAPTDPGINNVGLIAAIGPGGVVRNLNITNASVTANPNVTGPGQFVGIVAGTNAGRIDNVTVSGVVTNGTAQSGVIAGGLVGQNGDLGKNQPGMIANSHAAVNVTVGDATCGCQDNNAGGLVGTNPGRIVNSDASGTVTGGAFSFIGGLVGTNFDTGSIRNSFATGNVNLTATSDQSTAGGLVGFNSGFIGWSHATGTVTSASTVEDNAISQGGLVGFNDFYATIVHSYAIGAVSGPADQTGGLVGANHGFIAWSHATGPVGSTTDGTVGGLVGENGGTILFSWASGNVSGTGSPAAGGLVGANDGFINHSYATGNISIVNGTFSTGGGLVGANEGWIANSYATGSVDVRSVTGFAGGLVGFNLGEIRNTHATGNVTASGGVEFAGGLVGLTLGDIRHSFATGNVTAGDTSFVGGLVGANISIPDLARGTITQAYALGRVSGGANSLAGGLIGLNLGSVDQTYAAGFVHAGPNSVTGGLVALGTVPDGFDPNAFIPISLGPHITNLDVGPMTFTLPSGTVTNSYWDTQTTGQNTSAGGTPQTTAQLIAGLPAGFFTPAWQSTPGNYPCFSTNCTPPPTPGPPATPDDVTNPVVISPLLVIEQQLIKDQDLTQQQGSPVPTTTTTPHGPNPGGPGGTKPPSWFGPNAILGSGMPPLNETRYVSDEVVVQLRANVTPDELTAIEQQLGLVVISTQEIGLLGRTVYRFRITSGLSVRDVIAAFEKKNFIAQAQPSYVFMATQDGPAPASATTGNVTEGDSAQYIVSKLRLPEVHKLATGKGVLVAVVDSAIDVNHPDLAGVIAGKFDSADTEEKPHAHGTGMAGAIASHKRLIGIAPNARLLAIQAFGVNSGSAQGTSLNIVKGLNWAVDQGARVINMSFAGPMDPIMQQAIKALHEKGIILIAAAGNAGPKSPPLYPGADPNVIAVSATDVDDQTYKNANRGRYIAISAPGVDILVPAPEGGYQLTTGTSVAAAHISGVAALMLERNPGLKPDALRKALMSTADKPAGSRPEDIGAGLVDPYKALLKVDPKSAAVQ